MNSFLRKILDATRLTRGGQLTEATATIQRALAAAAAAPAAAAPLARSSLDTETSQRVDQAIVLDGLVRDVDEPEVISRPSFDEAAANAVAPPLVEVPRQDAERGARFVESSFTGASGTRAFKLFEPAGFAGRALPLVVMLHGCTQDPDDFAAGTRMNELAQELGFFVLYPAQAAGSNAHKCWNWFVPSDQKRGLGEPALIAGMTRHVMQTHGIDAERVYVAGLSAGAAMAAILAREYADLFAAVGMHSGLPAGAAHDVASAFSAMKSGSLGSPPAWPPVAAWSGPVRTAPPTSKPSQRGSPTIVFHGDADATVAPANSNAVIAAVLGNETSATQMRDTGTGAGGRRYTRTVWRPANGAADAPSLAEHWVVHGAPHAWSGGAVAGSYTDPTGPDASREMLRFFLEHPRPRGD